MVVFVGGPAGCRSAPRGSCDEQGPIRTHCGFENPEDLVWAPEHDAVVVSQMRRDDRGGSLALWAPGDRVARPLWPREKAPGLSGGPAAGDPACPPPSPSEFAPHGLFLGPGGLYVVNHGGRESVEIFRLEGRGPGLSARWLGCIELPAGASGNDVAVGPHGDVFVSNPIPPGRMLRDRVRSFFTTVPEDVLHWRSGEGWETVPGSEASTPNGVAVTADGQWLYYSESGAGRIVKMRPDGSERTEIPVPGRPDNLTWSPTGELLVASHLSTLELVRCLASAPCRAPWVVVGIDPATAKVRTLLEHDGARIGAVATAEPVGDEIYLSAVFGDRIGAWTPEKRSAE
jgi:hypothetical protein